MSGRASQITPQQCKRGRALLKWNPQDLASRTRIPVRHIEKFERNQVKLLKPENQEIIEAFGKKNVVFLSNGEVELQYGSASSENQGTYERTAVGDDMAPSDMAVAIPLTEAEAEAARRVRVETEKKVNIGQSTAANDD